MGYITFDVRRGDLSSTYIFFVAEYLGEAWLAKVKEDESTKIIKQFRHVNLKDCMEELVISLDHLGEVKKISATDIDQAYVARLSEMLIGDGTPRRTALKTSVPTSLLPYKNMWNWIVSTLPNVNMVN